MRNEFVISRLIHRLHDVGRLHLKRCTIDQDSVNAWTSIYVQLAEPRPPKPRPRKSNGMCMFILSDFFGRDFFCLSSKRNSDEAIGRVVRPVVRIVRRVRCFRPKRSSDNTSDEEISITALRRSGRVEPFTGVHPQNIIPFSLQTTTQKTFLFAEVVSTDCNRSRDFFTFD